MCALDGLAAVAIGPKPTIDHLPSDERASARVLSALHHRSRRLVGGRFDSRQAENHLRLRQCRGIRATTAPPGQRHGGLPIVGDPDLVAQELANLSKAGLKEIGVHSSTTAANFHTSWRRFCRGLNAAACANRKRCWRKGMTAEEWRLRYPACTAARCECRTNYSAGIPATCTTCFQRAASSATNWA
jgi:hypothetical protein